MNMQTALSYAVPLVHGAEGFKAESYLDTLARPPVWTIGRGTTRIEGRRVQEGMLCTAAQADIWAMQDMRAAALFVLHSVTVDLTDGQLGALISFCYNIGDGNFRESSVLEALNFGLYVIAADRLLEYDHAGGVQIVGLHTRRGRERALFLLHTTQPQVKSSLADSSADDLNAAELGRLNGANPIQKES